MHVARRLMCASSSKLDRSFSAGTMPHSIFLPSRGRLAPFMMSGSESEKTNEKSISSPKVGGSGQYPLPPTFYSYPSSACSG